MKKASAEAKVENNEKLDIDEVLHEVRKVRASALTMVGSIEGFYLYEVGELELEAMVNQAEIVFKAQMENLDRIIAQMREGGAKDYELSMPTAKEG